MRVGHAQNPAEMLVARAHALGGERGARLAERVLERVDDERRGNRLGHRGLRDRSRPILHRTRGTPPPLPPRLYSGRAMDVRDRIAQWSTRARDERLARLAATPSELAAQLTGASPALLA